MRNFYLKQRAAFTMIELVFAIVVIGILASLAMPRIDRDLINEASTNILADIRYTQHLALMDNKHIFDNANWQRQWWRIGFETCADDNTALFETVSSDTNMEGNIDMGEEALDPSSGLPMDIAGNCNAVNANQRMLVTDKYGITAITFTDVAPRGRGRSCTNVNHIGFDYLGRPHQGFSRTNVIPDYRSYLSQDCLITFTMSDATTFAIQITAETGHAFIVGQPDS